MAARSILYLVDSKNFPLVLFFQSLLNPCQVLSNLMNFRITDPIDSRPHDGGHAVAATFVLYVEHLIDQVGGWLASKVRVAFHGRI